APSAERRTSAAGKPQPPGYTPRSRFARPSTVHSPKTRSPAKIHVTIIGLAGFPRRRFHDQSAQRRGTPNAAILPNDQTSPNASAAPAGPQAFGLSQAG